jgi:hypothetical protein
LIRGLSGWKEEEEEEERRLAADGSRRVSSRRSNGQGGFMPGARSQTPPIQEETKKRTCGVASILAAVTFSSLNLSVSLLLACRKTGSCRWEQRVMPPRNDSGPVEPCHIYREQQQWRCRTRSMSPSSRSQTVRVQPAGIVRHGETVGSISTSNAMAKKRILWPSERILT